MFEEKCLKSENEATAKILADFDQSLRTPKNCVMKIRFQFGIFIFDRTFI